MKKVKAFLVLMSIGLFAYAQPNAGSIVLMGGGGFFTNTQTTNSPNNSIESKFNQGFVDFGVMYMLMDPLGVGLSLVMNNSSQFLDGKKKFSTSLTGARIMGRYYSPCMAPRFYTYGQLDLSFAGGSQKTFDNDENEIEDEREKVSQFGVGVRPGFAYFLTPAISLEMSFAALAWNQTKTTSDNNNDFNTVNSDLEFFAFSKSLSIGFCWWLGRSGERFN